MALMTTRLRGYGGAFCNMALPLESKLSIDTSLTLKPDTAQYFNPKTAYSAVAIAFHLVVTGSKLLFVVTVVLPSVCPLPAVAGVIAVVANCFFFM